MLNLQNVTEYCSRSGFPKIHFTDAPPQISNLLPTPTSLLLHGLNLVVFCSSDSLEYWTAASFSWWTASRNCNQLMKSNCYRHLAVAVSYYGLLPDTDKRLMNCCWEHCCKNTKKTNPLKKKKAGQHLRKGSLKWRPPKNICSFDSDKTLKEIEVEQTYN